MSPAPVYQSGSQRDWNTWERTHLLYGLHACGRLVRSARVLVCAVLPDRVIGTLSELVERTEVLDLTRRCAHRGAAARLFWSNGAYYARGSLAAVEPHLDIGSLAEGAYDAVVFPHGSLLWDGVPGIARLLSAAERLLAGDGVIAFKADILAGDQPCVDQFDYALAAEFAAQLEAAGLTVVGGFDRRLSQLTAARTEAEAQAEPAGDSACLVRRHHDRLAAASFWFLRKTAPARADRWAGLRDYLLDRLLGEQLDRLLIGPAGARAGSGGIVASRERSGNVFFGPYIPLPNGRYEAVIGVRRLDRSSSGRLTFDIAVNRRRAVSTRALGSPGDTSTTVHLPFQIDIGERDDLQKVEIRGGSDGVDAEIFQCRLLRA